MGFTGIDYAVLVIFLAGNVLLGTWLGRGQKTINDYFLAGKRIPMWAISLSIVATETSTLTFIGAPAIAYSGNLTFLQLAFGYIIGKILVSTFLIPAYFKGEIQTAYQLLQARFGQAVRTFSSLLFLGTRGLSDGVRLFATGLVLAAITQMSDLTTMIVIGAITVLYTYFGGMTAVIWTDVIQLFIYIAGAIVAFFLLLDKIPGGWSEVVATAAPLQKFQFLDFTFDITRTFTFWAGIIGGAFLTFATHGSDQMMVQRYLASGSKRDSQVALIWSGVIVFFQFILFLVIGVMLFAFYQSLPAGAGDQAARPGLPAVHREPHADRPFGTGRRCGLRRRDVDTQQLRELNVFLHHKRLLSRLVRCQSSDAHYLRFAHLYPGLGSHSRGRFYGGAELGFGASGRADNTEHHHGKRPGGVPAGALDKEDQPDGCSRGNDRRRQRNVGDSLQRGLRLDLVHPDRDQRDIRGRKLTAYMGKVRG